MDFSRMEIDRAEERWDDLTLTIDQLVGIAGRWLPAMTLLSVLPYFLLHGLPAAPEWSGLGDAVVSILLWTVIGVVVYAVSAVIHEVLHIVAMVLVARVPLSSLRFGMRLSEGVLYVHTDRAMTAAAYRVVLLLPAVVQGILPAAIGTVVGIGWLVLYGYVMIVSAIGDFAVLQLIRPLGTDAIVRDHPAKIGCQVLAGLEQPHSQG